MKHPSSLTSLRLDAKPYRPYKTDVKRWTEVLNHLLYQGQLPPYRQITIRRMKSYAEIEWYEGKRGRYCNIAIRDKFSSFGVFFSVLAHEIVHLADWVERGTTQSADHGKFFFSHKERLKDIGVKLASTY